MRPGDLMTVTLPKWVSVAEEPVRSQQMDEAGFRAFYVQTAPTLWKYIRRASGNADLADDILQEAFFRFLRANLPLMESAQMKAYVYRTATSLLADHWRRVKRERSWSLANWFVGERAAREKSDGGTMETFAQLKPQEQSLLWLAYVEGFDHRQIASALRLKEGSVRVLLFRARRKLAGLLEKQGIVIGEQA